MVVATLCIAFMYSIHGPTVKDGSQTGFVYCNAVSRTGSSRDLAGDTQPYNAHVYSLRQDLSVSS